MKEKVLGALKAVAPTLVALGVIGINAAFGSPVDVDAVRTLVVGAFTSLVVYFVPNASAG